MFRFLPIRKGGIFPKHLSSPTCYLSHSHSVSHISKISNHTNETSKSIDFELLFNACTTSEAAKRVHALLIVSGKAQNIFFATRLVNKYSHLGNISLSRDTFNQVPKKDSYTWNSIISAYVRNSRFDEAVKCAFDMLSSTDVRPDFYTFPPVLKACKSLTDGTRFHCWILKMGFEWDVFVSASLVHMYCRFGYANFANTIFKDMPFRDMGCWNSMISGFFQNGNANEALAILEEMMSKGVNMDSVTISTMLSIFAQNNDILCGMVIHLFAIKHGLEFNLFVSNALINMYAKFGYLDCAQKVFDQMGVRDLVSWNSIIAAYEQNDCPDNALVFFDRMKSNNVRPDILTLVSLSSCLAQTKDYLCSKSVHGFVIRRCWITKDTVIGNGVVDMYAKLGLIDYARRVFDNLPFKDVISWNTMITGYTQNGLASEASNFYQKLKENEDVKPNQGTWVSILPAYAHLGSLRDGTGIHCRALKQNIDSDIYVGTCLIDLYGKCGRLSEAMFLFDEVVPRDNIVTWNAIISCHGLHGLGEMSLKFYDDMLNEGVKPDHVTFLSLLTACSHSGLVDEGKQYFSHVMQQKHGIKPTLKHYGCMVDLYGRAGNLETAYDLILSMPMRPDASIWGALLGACRIHGDVEMGRKASARLFELDSGNVGYYVLLSNIYANFGRWEGVDEVRSLARERGLSKTPGWSSIELNNKTEVFYTGNRSHPQCEEIYKELGLLNDKLKAIGYSPDYSFVLQDVEDDEKESILMSHSERLAIMYGILNTAPKTSIRIFKNLRVCGDCHNVTKLISKLTEREIIVRDSNRFHHFRDGVCSCGDYW
ncbi:hypothetical protein CASFOL_003831 [Castilleja foliolosa]|uniref:DYW domain-containing protein n=1 Tax=Castilleja foliolosa TaxID=1961234 RepID=A0ABD3EIB6_9LAMI